VITESPDDLGVLRHRLTWQTFDTTSHDAVGQPTRTLLVMGTYWARVEPLSGMELMNARQLKAVTSHKITMRNIGPVKPSDNFLFEATGRRFEVDSVFRLEERNAYLILHCTELKVPQ
jgi:SPP1 family predicted phage head-tail adaptor